MTFQSTWANKFEVFLCTKVFFVFFNCLYHRGILGWLFLFLMFANVELGSGYLFKFFPPKLDAPILASESWKNPVLARIELSSSGFGLEIRISFVPAYWAGSNLRG